MQKVGFRSGLWIVALLAVNAAAAEPAAFLRMSKDELRAAALAIETELKSATRNCNYFSGNANDICLAEAKAKMLIGMAELAYQFQSSPLLWYEYQVVRLEADYTVAIEVCDDRTSDRDVCLHEAKAGRAKGLEAAKSKWKTSNPSSTAPDNAEVAARKEAEQQDANHTAAKALCNLLAGGTKTLCLDKVRVTYGSR